MSTSFSTPDLCDAYERVKVFNPGLVSYGARDHFCGCVVTVKCFEDNSLVKEQVSTPGEGKVLVVDAGGSYRCGMLGDNLALQASQNGWSGVVIWGCIRDVEIIATLDIAVRALGVHPRKSVKKGQGELNVPIHILGVDVTPGCYIYGDLNGVILSEQPLHQ